MIQEDLIAKLAEEGVPDSAKLAKCVSHLGKDATVEEVMNCINEHFESPQLDQHPPVAQLIMTIIGIIIPPPFGLGILTIFGILSSLFSKKD